MSIGIVAEYNPFHNGHIYQLNYIKNNFPNEEIIVVMSGDYVQRGERAIASFEERKRIALKYGVSKVIEIPQEFVIQAAHIFAQKAIELLNDQKVTKIVFGSETNNIDLFYDIAYMIKDNLEIYNSNLKLNLKNGNSFPKAVSMTLESLFAKSFVMPNDILGIEYVKAIVNNNYKIKAISIKREIGFHSDETIGNLASATRLRKMIFNGEDISKYSPMIIKNIPKRIQDEYGKFQEIIKTKKLDEISKINLVSEGMENLFFKNIDEPDYDSFVNSVNSKRYTSSRIKRVILQIILHYENEKKISEKNT
ncbi:MAG: nucleotidyltransferase [Metamycoplasmataceae bacterium]